MTFMALEDRLEHEVTSPSRIEHNGTTYIRCEYFEDGNRIFFSPLDFALNGPNEGSVIMRTQGPYKYKVKMGKRHYENNSTVPFMCEVIITMEANGRPRCKDQTLWVVIEATDIAVEKFKLRLNQGSASYCYSLQPQFFLDKGLCMMTGSDNNDVSIAFSIVTGIPRGHLILEDKV